MAHQQDAPNGSSAGIPLHCNVCPKQPDFSDVSHLLTHIASKGHLSNYYKLKIKSTSDGAAQRVTEEYDRWYEEYNVQELMGERMKQKEKRKSSNGAGSAGQTRRTSAGQQNVPDMSVLFVWLTESSQSSCSQHSHAADVCGSSQARLP